MSLKKAIRLLINEGGKKLDKRVVDAFIRYYSKSQATDPEYRAAFSSILSKQRSNTI
jgi:hypothetical protein